MRILPTSPPKTRRADASGFFRLPLLGRIRKHSLAYMNGIGAIAQLGERLHGMQEVRGSIPLGSTITFQKVVQKQGVAGTLP